MPSKRWHDQDIKIRYWSRNHLRNPKPHVRVSHDPRRRGRQHWRSNRHGERLPGTGPVGCCAGGSSDRGRWEHRPRFGVGGPQHHEAVSVPDPPGGGRTDILLPDLWSGRAALHAAGSTRGDRGVIAGHCRASVRDTGRHGNYAHVLGQRRRPRRGRREFYLG